MGKNKYNYLAKNTILFTISSFGSKILVFLLVPFYTSVLSTSDYGIADLINTTANLLIFVLTIDIADSVLRFAIETTENQEGILSYGLKILSLGTLLLGFSLILISKLELLNWNLNYYLFLFLIFFVLALNQILTNYLRAINKIEDVAIAGIIVTIITIVSNLFLLLYLNLGINGYLWSIVIGNSTSCLFCFWKIGLGFIGKKCKKEVKRVMRRYSIPLIFNGVAWWMNSSLDKYFVVLLVGSSANGILAVANKIPTIFSVFQNIFAQAWNLSAIKDFDKNDSDCFFSKTYSVYNALLVLVCSILIFCNVPLAKILFSKDFFEAWKYSCILLVSGLFSALSSFCGSIFTAVKDSKIFAISTILSAIINIILNSIMIRIWGIQGAVIATAVSFLCIWLMRLRCTFKYIKWKVNIKKDLFAYALLILQIIFEHMNGHMYWGQFGIFIVLIILYRKWLFSIVSLMKSICNKKQFKAKRE